ncbi:hypothetical protein M408DRAFT_90716 [Serendipita vermifera MAFF 305830]|uniref:Yeast cell wall synthesis Kre9/Knh1-like N-terminal domain-containing protein n=1 Tax=Serendipita vermifera MAFF 305830 TaxID=933852 RepID=A0A0C3BPX2_SERVB|nr:hypothetical protein M408DRAFT_90716 [Serendipita vermifera MAFF 305830]
MLASAAFILAALAYAVAADPVPLEPSSTSVFNEGSNCTILWTPDTTGTWTTMYIELMTGDNFNQVHLKTVATVDGTDTANPRFSYPCLDVTPNSPIYFYKFTSPGSTTGPLFTTRFTIADSTGTSTPATETQNATDGTVVRWGTGALTDPTQGDAPPPTSGGTSTGNTTASGSASSGTVRPTGSSSSTLISSGTGTSTASTSSRTNGASKVAAGSIAVGAVGALAAALFL